MPEWYTGILERFNYETKRAKRFEHPGLHPRGFQPSAAVETDTERTEREVAFLESELALGNGSTVLDLACGSGRHALALAPKVNDIVGHDIGKQFIDRAQAQAEKLGLGNAKFTVSDMRELEFEAHFDAVYNYFTAWGYYDFETNLEVLERVHRALKPGGSFLLEILNRDALMARFQPKDHKRMADGTVLLNERRFDCATGRMHTSYTYIKDGLEESMQIDHYIPAPDALVRHLNSAGFKNVRLLNAPDGGAVTIASWRIAVVGEV